MGGKSVRFICLEDEVLVLMENGDTLGRRLIEVGTDGEDRIIRTFMLKEEPKCKQKYVRRKVGKSMEREG